MITVLSVWLLLQILDEFFHALNMYFPKLAEEIYAGHDCSSVLYQETKTPNLHFCIASLSSLKKCS